MLPRLSCTLGLLALIFAAACGGEAGTVAPAQDGGSARDGGVAAIDGGVGDAGLIADAGVADAGVADAGVADAGVADAGLPSACHSIAFGAPAAAIRHVTSLPNMTGMAIPLGVYDAIEAQSTTASVSDGGTYRAAWSFTTSTRIDSIEQLTLSGVPPMLTPRSFSWSTTGVRLLRNGTCASTSTFDNEYSVRTDGGTTFLDMKQSSVMFTFKKR